MVTLFTSAVAIAAVSFVEFFTPSRSPVRICEASLFQGPGMFLNVSSNASMTFFAAFAGIGPAAPGNWDEPPSAATAGGATLAM